MNGEQFKNETICMKMTELVKNVEHYVRILPNLVNNLHAMKFILR